MIQDFIDYQYKKALKFRLCTCSNKHVYTVGDTCKLCNKQITDFNSKCTDLFYTYLDCFLIKRSYYIPEFKSFSLLGLQFWKEFLINDLICSTNLYFPKKINKYFTNCPCEFISILINIYMAKNNIQADKSNY